MLRIGFTIIFNGLHHLQHQMYAKQILKDLDYWIVVEGASKNEGSTAWCKPMPFKYHTNGMSTDGTVDYLRELKNKYSNLIFIESKRLWSSKDEMVNVALDEARKITGKDTKCFLWEIDIDEHLTPGQRRICEKELLSKGGKTGKFHVYQYVGKDIIAVGEWIIPFNRLWIWCGERFKSHEPPVLEGGNEPSFFMSEYIKHYSFYFERDVKFKDEWYTGHDGLYECWKKLQDEKEFPKYITYLFPKWVNNETYIEKIKKFKVRNLIFYNHYHNGDIHYSREFVKDIMDQIDFEECFYMHKNNPKILRDIPHIKYKSLDNKLKSNKEFFFDDEDLYINTWVGQDNDGDPAKGRYLQITGRACSLYTHYELFRNIYSKLSLQFKHIEFYLPQIDYSKFNLEKINEFVKKYEDNVKVLICNGEVLSWQSGNFSFNSPVYGLSRDYKDVIFILTDDSEKMLKIPNENVFYTSDIIGIKENDLNEISYLSTFCNIIVGRASGPYAFAQVKDNFFDKNKTFIGFTTNMWDSYWYQTSTCGQVWSTEYNDIYNIIENEIKKEKQTEIVFETKVIKQKTIKEICEELLEKNEFSIYLGDHLIFNTSSHNKEKLKFFDDYFIYDENKISYRNIRIKKI